MHYVINFTSMQYMSTSVDTGAEGMLSTIVACGGVNSSIDMTSGVKLPYEVVPH